MHITRDTIDKSFWWIICSTVYTASVFFFSFFNLPRFHFKFRSGFFSTIFFEYSTSTCIHNHDEHSYYTATTDTSLPLEWILNKKSERMGTSKKKANVEWWLWGQQQKKTPNVLNGRLSSMCGNVRIQLIWSINDTKWQR